MKFAFSVCVCGKQLLQGTLQSKIICFQLLRGRETAQKEKKRTDKNHASAEEVSLDLSIFLFLDAAVRIWELASVQRT